MDPTPYGPDAPPPGMTAEPPAYPHPPGPAGEREVNVETILPLAAWLSDRPWNLASVRWFLFFGVFPLVLALVYDGEGNTLGRAAWALGVYFALMWLTLLRVFMRPDNVGTSLHLQVGGFTAIFGILGVLVLQRVPGISALYSGAASDNLVPRWIGSVFGVGLVEEGAKLLPVYLFLFQSDSAYKPLTYSYLGVVSGLSFGVAEAVRYSYLYAQGLVHGQLNLGDYIVIQFLRLITLPLLHACFCGIAAYFVGLATLRRNAAPELILTGLCMAAILHGTYDTFASNLFGIAIAILSLLIFVSYVRSADAISRELVGEGIRRPPV